MTDPKSYLVNASKCFNKVADVIKANPSGLPFWHVGRTLNTCQDYITHNGSAMPHDVTRFKDEVLPTCSRFYITEAGAPENQNWWWDDYGWWGLAHLATGNLEKAKDCWLRMRNYGVDTTSSSPDYLGGCWNHTIAQDPAGCENSVTNSTFFLLCVRLLRSTAFAKDPLRPVVVGAAAKWVRWFNHWQGRAGAIRNPLKLVRERPVGDKDNLFPNGQPTYEIGWIWTGDQGLAMAWAAEAFHLPPNDWNTLFPGQPDRGIVFSLAGEIRNGMAPLFDVDGVLHEAPYFANSLGQYNIDYSSGRGVFMGYLSCVDTFFQNQPNWPSSAAHIKATADAVIARLGDAQPTMYSWNYATEQAVLDTWKKKVAGPSEGNPSLCNAAPLMDDPRQQLVFYGIALDALTAATAVPP